MVVPAFLGSVPPVDLLVRWAGLLPLLRSLPKSRELLEVRARGRPAPFKPLVPLDLGGGIGEMSIGSQSGRPDERRGGELSETLEAKETSSSSEVR